MKRHEQAVVSVDRWLTTKHGTLWGQAFDLTDDARRRAAAEWFVGNLVEWSGWQAADDELLDITMDEAKDAIATLCRNLGITDLAWGVPRESVTLEVQSGVLGLNGGL